MTDLEYDLYLLNKYYHAAFGVAVAKPLPCSLEHTVANWLQRLAWHNESLAIAIAAALVAWHIIPARR